MTGSPNSTGTAVITGASSGIGSIYANRLARRGHDLLLVARNRARLEDVATQLAAQTGRKIDILVADLTDKKDLVALEQRIADDSAIRMLVNNAGFNVGAPVSQADPDQMETMIQLNTIALTRLSRAAAPAFVARGGGTIVNIASIVAVAPGILNGAYSGSKAYVVNFSQSLQLELGAQGLRVQAVLPGATRTEFWDVSGISVDGLPQDMVMDAQVMVDAALAGLDMGELITIPALADAASWSRLESARESLVPQLSRSEPAPRYRRAVQA